MSDKPGGQPTGFVAELGVAELALQILDRSSIWLVTPVPENGRVNGG